MRKVKKRKHNRHLKNGAIGFWSAHIPAWPAIRRRDEEPEAKKANKLRNDAPRYMQLGQWLHERRLHMRLAYFSLAGLIVFSLVSQFANVFLIERNYTLSDKAMMVVGNSSSAHATSLRFDPLTNVYEYNKGYKPGGEVAGSSYQPRFSASFHKDPEQGVKVVDPVTETSVTFKPDFAVALPRQDENRLLYPITGQDAVKVYTLKTIGFKEDIVLNSFIKDELSYTYELDLPEGSEARMESSGAVGVYGVSQALLGDVSTASDKDAKLLKNARENAPKNTLLFTFPAPVVAEFDVTKTEVNTWFTLEDNKLTVHADNLKQASYPLSIDPSVYVETAAKLMRGNNETNIAFDVDNELIQKGATTGARFNEWDSAMALNEGRWNHGTAVAGGYIYSVGGSKSNVSLQTFSSVGSSTFNVPPGVTSITVKMWGGGGGGGGGGTLGTGGSGGGGGYARATLSVTPSESLNVFVGGAGGAGGFSSGGGGTLSGDGGGGAGRSLIARGSTNLVIAPGGGGGAGGDNSSATSGGNGGSGGGTSGLGGSASGSAPGGGGGTASAGGAGGDASGSGNNGGSAGGLSQGGDGGDGGDSEGCGDGGMGNGGAGGAGNGGAGDDCGNGFGGGGGGGGGYYGGGGGSASISSNAGGGGGGGGSGLVTGTATTLTAGSGTSPGNSSDPLRGTAGEAGIGGDPSASGTAGNPGIIVITYETGGGANTTEATLTWARLSTADNSITSPNPGTGSCPAWCEDNAYDLPAPRKGLSLVAYNGFLYAIGGIDGSGNYTNTVFIAKLGVNGEPSLWHPTDTNKNNWDYWYTAGTLSSNRAFSSAVAYNNRLYLLGGRTSSGNNGVNTAQLANINPNGTLGSWTSVTNLPSVRYGHGAQIYNGYLYLIGGNSGGTLQDTVQYIKINDDGTLVSSWASTNSFTSARQNWGGNNTVIYGGYMYLMGGCSAINGSGYCTAVADDVQLVSINADGSVGNWRTMGGVNTQRMGFGVVAWDNAIYRIGGCSSQDASSGDCLVSLETNDYGVINPDGDASTVALTQPSGSGDCVGGDPFGCDLPPAGDDAGEIGHLLSATAIMNGYLYVIGGCTDTSGTDCTSGDAISSNTAYAAIDSDGTLHRSPSCVGSYYGSWCVDNTHLINGTTGVMAASTAVFEGNIYVVGGIDNSGTGANSVFRIAIDSDGSLSNDDWQAQDFSSLGISGEIAYSFSYARSNPSSAQTSPGNLYIFGGCGDVGSGLGCSSSNYRSEVYKCNIQSSGAVAACSTSGQLQIDAELGDESDQGLGTHSGAVYANYIYLVGGISPNVLDRDTIFYAKFDNNNNVVSVDTSAAGSDADDWKLSDVTMLTGRRRGASFGYNGYLYVLGGFDGGGGVGDIEFAKFNVSDGSIGPFTSSTVTTGQRWGLSLVASNSYAYLIGGCIASSGIDCSDIEDSLQIFQIYNNNSGTPAGYASAGASGRFATDRFGAGATVYNGYIYVAGGCVSTSDCDNATNSVEYATLNSDGTIGSWATTGSLLGDRVFGQLEQAGGSLYFIGGQDDSETPQSTVYYATPASNGSITSWSAASGGIGDTSGGSAVARSQLSASSWNNRIYVTGGYDASSTYSNAVYVSPQLNSGGNIAADSWTSTTGFSVARSHHTTIAYANNLYVLGGFDGAVPLSDVQYTQINSDGTLDGWTYTTSLPQRIRGSDGFAANGYMYLFGGKLEDLTCNNNTYVAPISANTSVASGNNPTGIGEWFVTNQKFNGERAGAAAVYNEGKAFVLGGACGTLDSGTTTTVMQDDLDPGIDGSMWSSTPNMSVGIACGTLVSGNALYSTGDNDAIAETKDVDVLNGGTVSFYLRIPASGGSPCWAPNSSNEDVVLQYSNNGGSGWSTIATYQEDNFDSATLIEETIPVAARTSNTRFRWYNPNADNNRDQWAIDDIMISANDTPPLIELLEDNFDPTIDGADWISTSGMSVGTTCGTISSGNNLHSTGGPGANAITTDVDLRYGGLVQFWLRIPTNSGGGCDTPEGGEDLQLQYSTNSGSSWTTFATYDEQDYNTPQEVTAVLPEAGQSTATRFRWIIPNATSGAFDQWALDDVSISAFQSVLAYTNQHRVVYTTLLSQPQVAKYSRMIDTDTDVFPNTWLLNGVDNFIGARWNVRYRSMHDLDVAVNPNEDCGTSATMPTMTTWGQDTNFGGVTLGKIAPYVPKNSSGGDINCARYYYFFVEIDASQTFGYPEDVSRGPTITDLTLFFTSDPSKRLRHGKTFTGGEQQPLDTPCRYPTLLGGSPDLTADPNRNNCPLPED